MPRKKAAVNSLVTRINSANKVDGAKALSELIALGPDGAAAATALRPLLRDKDPAKSLGARAALAAIGEDTASHVDALIERAALGKSDESTAARGFLRDLPIGALSDGIARAFDHDNPVVRARAVDLAGTNSKVREAITVDEIIEHLTDADPKVREAAVLALANHLAPTPPAKPTVRLTADHRKAIQPLTTDPDKNVAAQAKRLWERLVK